MDSELKAKRILDEFNLRFTQGRAAIVKILHDSNCAVSRNEILSRLNYSLNKTTVYRAIDCFVDCGLVHLAYTKNGVNYYGLCKDCGKIQCHPHFECRKCGVIFCLKDCSLPKLVDVPDGFKVLRQKVKIEGLCKKCQQKDEYSCVKS